MIEVTRNEAEIIRKTFKGDEGRITKTMVQRSSRGKSYAVETKKVLDLLDKLRNN